MEISKVDYQLSPRVFGLLGLSAYEELNLAINLDAIAISMMNMMACSKGCEMVRR